jgi:hypothetical protein
MLAEPVLRRFAGSFLGDTTRVAARGLPPE